MADTLPALWWRDKDLLYREVQRHGSLRAAATATGVNKSTLQSAWRNHGLPKLAARVRAELALTDPIPAPKREAGEDAWLLDMLKTAGDATVEQIADAADRSPKRVREAAERLQQQGYRVDLVEHKIKLDRVPSPTGFTHEAAPELFDGELIRFGVVSDVHLGSVAENIGDLETAYEMLRREGIRVVYNPGDIVDGLGIYRNQSTEILFHTYGAQVDHAVEHYPTVDGMTTYLISGNHDCEGDVGKVGADAALAVSLRRPDIIHLGRYDAWIDLPNGGRIHMLHPMGGGAYAKSYKLQKLIESYIGGQKPSVALVGHYHQAMYLPDRGVHALHSGTLQGPTSFSKRKALGQAGYGFWIVEATMAEDGSLVRFKPEFLPFYAGRKVAA